MSSVREVTETFCLPVTESPSSGHSPLIFLEEPSLPFSVRVDFSEGFLSLSYEEMRDPMLPVRTPGPPN